MAKVSFEQPRMSAKAKERARDTAWSQPRRNWCPQNSTGALATPLLTAPNHHPERALEAGSRVLRADLTRGWASSLQLGRLRQGWNFRGSLHTHGGWKDSQVQGHRCLEQHKAQLCTCRHLPWRARGYVPSRSSGLHQQ